MHRFGAPESASPEEGKGIMPRLLTDTLIGALRKREGRLEVADSVAPGLRLRRTLKGDLVWSLWYRRRKEPFTATRFKLGTYSTDPEQGLTLAAARIKARAWASKIEEGADPQGSLQTDRATERKRRRAPKPSTVADIVNGALGKWGTKALALRPATMAEWKRRAEADILTAPFAKSPAHTLDPEAVEEWLSGMMESRSGHVANSARTVLLRCFSWACEQKKLADPNGIKLRRSPIADVAKPDSDAEKKISEHTLDADGLRAVMLALDEIDAEGPTYRQAYADATRLLLLTGVRRSAVLGLQRGELKKLETDEAQWLIPEARSKSGKEHLVPLSEEAERIILRRMDAVRTEHLFPQLDDVGKAIERPMFWSSHFVNDLKRRANRIHGAKLPAWKIHSFRSALSTLGREEDALAFDGEVIRWLLGHSTGTRIDRAYDRSTLIKQRRKALEKWARWLDGLKREEAGSEKVVMMKGRA